MKFSKRAAVSPIIEWETIKTGFMIMGIIIGLLILGYVVQRIGYASEALILSPNGTVVIKGGVEILRYNLGTANVEYYNGKQFTILKPNERAETFNKDQFVGGQLAVDSFKLWLKNTAFSSRRADKYTITGREQELVRDEIRGWLGTQAVPSTLYAVDTGILAVTSSSDTRFGLAGDYLLDIKDDAGKKWGELIIRLWEGKVYLKRAQSGSTGQQTEVGMLEIDDVAFASNIKNFFIYGDNGLNVHLTKVPVEISLYDKKGTILNYKFCAVKEPDYWRYLVRLRSPATSGVCP